MLGTQLIPSGFNNNAGGAAKGFAPGLMKGFSNSGNHLGQIKPQGSETGSDAGKVMLSRLMSSVESRFSASRVETAGALQETGSDNTDFSPQAVSDRILGFVKQRLEQEKANGASDERLQSLMAQAREGIEKGFAEARDIIVDQGIFTDEVKDNYLATVSQVQQGLDKLENQVSGESSETVRAESSTGLAGSSASRAQVASQELFYSESRSFDMQVKTRDGDVVTVRINGDESFRSSTFAASSDGVNVAGFDAQYSNSSQFSFSVEGDLDKGELAALNDLFSQVNDIADDFYEGDVEAAFNQAMEVGYDASELAGFAVNMRRTEVVAVKQVYAEVARYTEPGAVSGAGPKVNPLQSVMDKLSDFAAQVQEAQAQLLEAPASADGGKSLFAELLKSLVPADKAGMDGGEASNNSQKPQFDRFIDTLAA